MAENLNEELFEYIISSCNSNTICDLSVVESLFKQGANPNYINQAGWSVFLNTIYISKECIDLFLRYGADINLKNIHGVTILHMVCLSIKGNDDYEKLAKYLISIGADYNIPNNNGVTIKNFYNIDENFKCYIEELEYAEMRKLLIGDFLKNN